MWRMQVCRLKSSILSSHHMWNAQIHFFQTPTNTFYTDMWWKLEWLRRNDEKNPRGPQTSGNHWGVSDISPGARRSTNRLWRSPRCSSPHICGKKNTTVFWNLWMSFAFLRTCCLASRSKMRQQQFWSSDVWSKEVPEVFTASTL